MLNPGLFVPSKPALWLPSRRPHCKGIKASESFGVIRPAPVIITDGGWSAPPPAGGGTSVAVDAKSSTNTYQASNTSFSGTGILTVGAGLSHGALIITLVMGYSGSAPTSVAATWNGTTMFKINSFDSANNVASAYLFGLRNPASGNNTLALTWSNSAEIFVAGISFTGVDQSSNAAAFPNSVTSDGAALTETVTSAATDYVVCAMSPSSNPTLTGSVLFDDHIHGAIINAAANYAPGASPNVVIGTTNTTLRPGVATDVAAG